jgi:glucokinase
MVKKSTHQFIIGVDLGGTKIAVGLFTSECKLASQHIQLTNAQEGTQAVIESLRQAIFHLVSQANIGLPQIKGIGVAAAGAIDSHNGVVTLSPNLPGWSNIPLRQILNDSLGVPIYLMNDANAAAFGEYLFGAGQNASNLIYVTVSTGIGGGIIINGEVYEGVSGAAGEVGHMTIDINGPPCNCGSNGCLEMLASGSALAREARRQIDAGEGQAILEASGGDLAQVSAKTVFLAAQRGDRLAEELIRQTGRYLGIGLANLVNIFNPELIIIGGGLSNMGEHLRGPARKVMQERAYQISAGAVRIVPALLGSASGIIGAAAWTLRQSVRESL